MTSIDQSGDVYLQLSIHSYFWLPCPNLVSRSAAFLSTLFLWASSNLFTCKSVSLEKGTLSGFSPFSFFFFYISTHSIYNKPINVQCGYKRLNSIPSILYYLYFNRICISKYIYYKVTCLPFLCRVSVDAFHRERFAYWNPETGTSKYNKLLHSTGFSTFVYYHCYKWMWWLKY